MCGLTNWEMAGRKAPPKGVKANVGRSLWTPHTFKNLNDAKVRLIASGPAASHSIIVTEDNRCLAFGRNDKGKRYMPLYMITVYHIVILFFLIEICILKADYYSFCTSITNLQSTSYKIKAYIQNKGQNQVQNPLTNQPLSFKVIHASLLVIVTILFTIED